MSVNSARCALVINVIAADLSYSRAIDSLIPTCRAHEKIRHYNYRFAEYARVFRKQCTDREIKGAYRQFISGTLATTNPSTYDAETLL
jgi:hypothetical protein